ncbi:MAG TPA: hypothetical protein VF006_05535 [Longimicrobium sp.]
MSDRLTLATSTGLPFLSLAFHIGTGLVALAAGFMAIAVRKGGKWHRRSGMVFVYTMIATGLTAAAISAYSGKPGTGGALTAYLVFTGYTTVKPLPGDSRRMDIGLMLLTSMIAAVTYTFAFIALGRPGNQIDGVPAGMMFFMGTIVLLAAIGDVRMIRAGGIKGTRRLARHLWRMSFALFIASGSFFLGQMKFIPEPIRIVPVIVVLAVSPLVVLLYWMWRVRLKQNLRGMMTAKPIEARRPA